MSQKLKFKIVKHGGKKYQATVALRDVILRKPLGMQYTPGQLEAEKDQVHIACYQNKELVGCLVLVIEEDGKAKMRQVAVSQNHQSQGVGKELVTFSEEHAFANGAKVMYCHARDLAVPFYRKLGYKIIGEPFVEVSIPHFRMEKLLV